jgi:hypothetical protein
MRIGRLGLGSDGGTAGMRGSEILEVERAQHIIDVFSLIQGESATLGVASELDAQVPGEGPEVSSSNRKERASLR